MRKLPRVVANFAISADGKITTASKEPSVFTSRTDKRRLREIRAAGDALVVGAATVAADTMSMGISDKDLRSARSAQGRTPEPLRVIVSRTGRISPQLKVFRTGDRPPLIFLPGGLPAQRVSTLARVADIWQLDGGTQPATILRILATEYHVKSVICEGGPRLFRAFVEAGAIDELFLTIAPRIFGGNDSPGILGWAGPFLDRPERFRIARMETVGDECFLHLKSARQPSLL